MKERISFDDRIKDLQAFKEEHGHCNVPQSKSDTIKYRSLGSWCNNIYKIKQGHTPNRYKLSDAYAKIQRLEAVGFKWNLHEKK